MESVNQLSPRKQGNKFNYLILAILVVMYAPILWHWYDGWLNKSIGIEHEYFSHGLIGIPFAGYLVWLKRKSWQELPYQFNYLGLSLVALAGVLFLTGVSEFVNFSFTLILIGLTYFLKGKKGLELFWFPLLLIILAVPNSIPYLITPYTLWLQKIIAGISGFILFHLGFDVTVNGIYVAVNGRLVEVAPYCAGLKMLFTTLYVSLILLYWRDLLNQPPKPLILTIMAVITSVLGNVIRNTILAFFHGSGYDDLFTWFHDSWGGDVYSALTLGVIYLLVLWLETWQLNPTEINYQESEVEEFNFKF